MLAAALAAASILAAGAEARADSKQDCAAAYDKVQSFREQGKLIDARKQAVACGASTCSAYVTKDCVQWLAEIEASLPTVVFTARDPAGADTPAVRVTVDGQVIGERLDGKAVSLDPGEHVVRFEMEGAGPVEQKVLIRQGERNRTLSASFQKARSAEPPPPQVAAKPPQKVPSPGGEAQRRSVAPWIVGGVGVAGLAVGGILAGVVGHDKSVTDEPGQCTATMCKQAGFAAAQQGRTLGPVSTLGFIVGGAGVGVSAVWLLGRAPAQRQAAAATVGMGPAMMAGGGGWRLRGSW